jgi:hypothetical protein
MSDRVLLVTAPDDTLEQGLRISVLGLTPEQNLTVSKALLTLEAECSVVVYVWQNNESVDWILDKLYKSQLIIFNAEIYNQTLAGYLAAQHNSHYFGTLRTLKEVNKSEIYDQDQCLTILETAVKNYGKK